MSLPTSCVSVAGDVRYALRILAKEPWFTAAAIFILAIGIGASTAVFGLAEAVVFHPYPFPDPDRIVLLLGMHSSGQNVSTGYRDFVDWRQQSRSYAEMAIAPNPVSATLTGRGEPERLNGFIASEGIFRVLGVQAIIGRTFTAAEDREGAPRVVVLSYGAWQRLFGGSPDALGRSLTLDGNPHTVIGVLPKWLVFPGLGPCDYWMPLRENPGRGRYQHQYGVLARLKPGVSIASAQAEISGIARRLEQEYPDTNKGWGVRVMTLREALAGGTERPVTALFLGVALVLLLACANVAGLELARGSARAREIGIRASLGATRPRILRQLLTESVLLSLMGGLCGLAAARPILRLLASAAPEDLALRDVLHLDPRALAFAVAASVATGILFGVMPAIHGSRAGIGAVVRGGTAMGTRARNRTLSMLVVCEVALSMVLLVAAVQLARGLAWMLAADIGIRTDQLLTFHIDLPRVRYGEVPLRREFYRALLERLSADPGVTSAAAVDSMPLSGIERTGGLEFEGRTKPPDWTAATGQSIVVTPDYFRTMGIPIRYGRVFDERDRAESQPVAVISELLARRFFAGEDPIGHRIKDAYGGWRTVVGVVADVRGKGASGTMLPQLYRPAAQSQPLAMWMVVRTSGDPRGLVPVVRSAVREGDPAVVVMKLRTMREVISDSLSEPRMVTEFLSGFAGFALVLAVVGIYGTIAYSVAQRTKELGVRLALGASPAGVKAMVVRQAATLALAGVLVGIPVSLAATRVIGSWLRGTGSDSPATYAAVLALVIGVSVAASYVPARRAARVNPAVTLRDE